MFSVPIRETLAFLSLYLDSKDKKKTKNNPNKEML